MRGRRLTRASFGDRCGAFVGNFLLVIIFGSGGAPVRDPPTLDGLRWTVRRAFRDNLSRPTAWIGSDVMIQKDGLTGKRVEANTSVPGRTRSTSPGSLYPKEPWSISIVGFASGADRSTSKSQFDCKPCCAHSFPEGFASRRPSCLLHVVLSPHFLCPLHSRCRDFLREAASSCITLFPAARSQTP